MTVLLLFLLLAGMLSSVLGSKSLPSIGEYFPQLEGDLTKLRWAHAVNSLSLLSEALENNSVMMLEADVVLGTLIGQNKIIPIMVHLPQNTSDLSLEMFLKTVINAQKSKKKGIKLDFKTTECFQQSWEIIDPLMIEVTFPVFLNANILPGPVDSKVKPVDPKVFLLTSSSKFPASTLSIGWTTKFALGMDGTYTEDQLNSMKEALEKYKIKQPVTFCVRAKSPGIIKLVDEIDKYENSKNTTVTVWMSTDSDPVDVPKLRNLILTLKKSRVFLDVPKFLEVELNLNGKATKTPITAAQETLVAFLTSVSALFSNILLR